MKVSIEEIRDTIEKLEELVAEMEIKGKTEVPTESNTYFCNGQYISFGRNGFLDLESSIEFIISNTKEDSEENW